MLPLLPTSGGQDSTIWKRVLESINGILKFDFDDSRIRTAAEIAAGVTPTNYAYQPGILGPRYGVVSDGATDQTALLISLANSLKGEQQLIIPPFTHQVRQGGPDSRSRL
jgi:hypothetical protein